MPRLSGSEIINPLMMGMLHGAADFYPSACTIQQSTETNTLGEVSLAWANLAGHVNIPCQVGRAGGAETKRTNQTYDTATHTIGLAGHYPTITPKMRAVVSAVNYDVLAIRTDGYGETTWLEVQVVT